MLLGSLGDQNLYLSPYHIEGATLYLRGWGRDPKGNWPKVWVSDRAGNRQVELSGSLEPDPGSLRVLLQLEGGGKGRGGPA